MSIVFIFSGFLFLLCVFNFVNFNNQVLKNSITIMTLFFCLSFFFGTIDPRVFSVNLFSLFAYLLLFKIFCTSRFYNWFNVIYVLLVSMIYKVLIDYDADFLISFNYNVAYGLVLIFSMIYFVDICSGISFILNVSIIMLIISCCYGIDNFGYFNFDFNFVFEISLIYFVLSLIFTSLLSLIQKGRCNLYGKKNFNIFSSSSDKFTWLLS